MNRADRAQKTHLQSVRLFMSDWLYQEYENDVPAGDVTTQVCALKGMAQAEIVAKEKGILAGEQEIRYFLKKFPRIKIHFLTSDGKTLCRGESIAQLRGDIRDLMKTERIVLNVLGRMSGVATHTHKLLQKARRVNPRILLVPTRKTLWGLLDKRACVLGGGGTHRLSLSDAVLIKHNHLRASQTSLPELLVTALARSLRLRPSPKFFEVEVNNGNDAFHAARIFSEWQNTPQKIPCVIMFDNMSPKSIQRALHRIKQAGFFQHVLFEASGRITQKNITAYAKTGCDILSLGILTHSAPMLDMSLRVNAGGRGKRSVRPLFLR